MHNTIKPRLLTALIAIAFSGGAAASGFQLQNQSGSGNGNAFAGAAAAAEDAGTVFFNPAGMSYLPRGHNVSVSGTVIHRVIDFSDNGSSVMAGPAAPFFPLGGSTDGGDAGGTAFLPHGYWVWGASEQLSVGLGIGPTFGNKTEYDFDFVGRNAGYFAEIQQININPSLSWKINEQVSIGGGVNFAHNETHFKQGVPLVDPFGVVVPGVTFAANNHLDVKGDDWAVGYNLGTMFQLSKQTRIGLTYRSELKFDLEGKQKFAVPNAALVNQDITAKLKTPASASLAISHMVSDRLELLADYTWTDWSVVDTIQLKSKQTGADLSALSYNFKDTWRIGLGGNYQYNDNLKLRFGVAYDKSPVKSAADRTMTLPDTDRTWLSLGAKYKLTQQASVDVGYTHIFFAKGTTERAVDFPAGTTRQVISGDWDNSVDILSAQLNYNF